MHKRILMMSLPCRYCTIYTPEDQWTKVSRNLMQKLLPPLRKLSGHEALMQIVAGGNSSNSKKRKRDANTASSTPRSSCSSSSSGGGETSGMRVKIPTCLASSSWFRDAEFRTTNSRSRPDAVVVGKAMPLGLLLLVGGCRCIVHALLDNQTHVHKRNNSYVWVGSMGGGGNGTGEVYMRCLDPDCQGRVERSKSLNLFDSRGWGKMPPNY